MVDYTVARSASELVHESFPGNVAGSLGSPMSEDLAAVFGGAAHVVPATVYQQAYAPVPMETASSVPLLARATPLIGHFQIRNRGTVGGSLAHADPAAEYPAVALALEAGLEVLGPGGRRTVPATEFFTGLWSTVVGEQELLTGVTFPVWEGRCGFAVREFARRHGDFAVAGAAVAGVDPEEIGRLAMSSLDAVPSDLHGSAAYRRRVGGSMVALALLEAGEEARGG